MQIALQAQLKSIFTSLNYAYTVAPSRITANAVKEKVRSFHVRCC